MRPKIVIAFLLVGLAGLGGIFFLKNLTTRPQPVPAPIVQPVATPTGTQATRPVAPKVSPAATNTSHAVAMTPSAPIPQAAVHAVTGEAVKSDAGVQARIDKLQELQANDDAASLQAILSELTNSDHTIRAAAVESTIQFGSRDAIPVLKDLAARTGDPAEKKELLDAADFLALPTLTEIRAQTPNVKIIPAPARP